LGPSSAWTTHGTTRPSGNAGEVDTGRTGAFAFTLVAGRSYRVAAEVFDASAGWRFVESEPFVAGGDLPAYTVRLPLK
jgi:hypothetical protein